MYKWYFRIVDHIYHVLDSWDINGFVVFLLSCFHSDDHNWCDQQMVTAEWGWYRFSKDKFSTQVVWVWDVDYGNCHEICNLNCFGGLVVWPLWVLFNPTKMHAWCHRIEQWRGYSPIPMEMSTWSTPFFLLSKKMAPLRLTRRSAFSYSRPILVTSNNSLNSFNWIPIHHILNSPIANNQKLWHGISLSPTWARIFYLQKL